MLVRNGRPGLLFTPNWTEMTRKLHNERHKWKLEGGAGIRGVVLQSGWACSTVVQSTPPPPPPPPTQSQMDIIQWSIHKLQDENVQRL